MTDLHSLGKMLVIVPHQDDEILLTAGIIWRATQQGLPIDVAMVTNGDYGCRDQTVGHLRLRETLNSLEYLGLTQDHVAFLGYADTGMAISESFLSKLLCAEENERIASHCATATYALPNKPSWHCERFGQEAPYCRKSLQNDLESLLDFYQPDTVFTTALQDLHGDHSALCRFVLKTTEKRPCAVYQGVVHSLAGDGHWPLRNGEAPLTLPMGMEAYRPVRFEWPEDSWDSAFEEHRKLHALRCHVTAMKPDAVDFLSAFVKADELFFLPKEEV